MIFQKIQWTISFIFTLILLYNNSFCFYSEEQIKKYQQVFQFGVAQQSVAILNQMKINLSPEDLNPEMTNLFKILFDNNKDTDVLKPAVFIIGEKHLDSLTPLLLNQMKKKDLNIELKSEIIKALAKLNRPEITADCIQMIQTENVSSPLMTQAVFYLGKLKVKKASPDLQKLLIQNKNNDLASLIVDALYEMQDPCNQKALVTVYNDETRPLLLRSKIAKTIASFDHSASQEWVKHQMNTNIDPMIKISMLEGLLQQKVNITHFVSDIQSFIKSKDANVRQKAISLLPDIPYQDKVEFLKYTISNDGSEEIKEEAAKTLLKIDKNVATDYFFKNIEKGSNYTQTAILQALADPQEDFSFLISSFFPRLYQGTTNPMIRGALVQIATEQIKNPEAFHFLKDIVLNGHLKGVTSEMIKNRIIALQTLTAAYYDKMFSQIKDILENPNEENNLPLFNPSLQLICLSKAKANDLLLQMITNIHSKKYTTLQRSDIYMQLFYVKPEKAKNILLTNYSQETDPQIKFSIKRLLQIYGVNKA